MPSAARSCPSAAGEAEPLDENDPMAILRETLDESPGARVIHLDPRGRAVGV